MSRKWGQKGDLGLTKLGGDRFLSEFEFWEEASKALQKGERSFSLSLLIQVHGLPERDVC